MQKLAIIFIYVLIWEGFSMKFEKNPNLNEILPRSGCSGCSNQGQQVYSGNYSSQAASNAGRCSAS